MERRDRIILQKVLSEINKYQTLRMEDVYETVVTDFPALKVQIEELI